MTKKLIKIVRNAMPPFNKSKILPPPEQSPLFAPSPPLSTALDTRMLLVFPSELGSRDRSRVGGTLLAF